MNFLPADVMSAVVGAIAVVAVLLLMRRMAASPASVSAENTYVLEYGWLFPAGAFFTIAGAFFFAAMAWFEGTPERRDGWIAVGLVSVFGVGGICLLNEARRRVVLSRQAIEVLSPWGAALRLPWREVSSVAFSGFSQQFTIRGRLGEKVSVNVLMRGMPTFVDHLRQCLPPVTTRDALQQYAQNGEQT